MFLENKYYKRYKELTSKQDRNLECYTEKHHIIPKSMGGLDTKENLVVLTAREHYIAHLLLTKITKGANKKKMAFALWNMINRDNGKRTSSRVYDSLRKAHSEFLSIELSGEGNPMFGKKHTEETKKKISLGGIGMKRSDETRTKISTANKGENNPMFGIPKTEKQKRITRERMKLNNPMFNEASVEKMKESKKGTINCFDVVEQKFVRIFAHTYNLNKDRYKNNNSKEAKNFKESKDVK